MSDLKEQPSGDDVRQAEELAKAFREVLELASGKRVLFWILEQCAIYSTPYAGENIASTNHSLGRQDVGLRLIAELNAIDPRIYPRMLLDLADAKAMEKAVQDASAKTEDDDDAP